MGVISTCLTTFAIGCSVCSYDFTSNGLSRKGEEVGMISYYT